MTALAPSIASTPSSTRLPCGSVTSIELPASISGTCPVTLTALGATVTVAPLIGLVAISELALDVGAAIKSATIAMLSTRMYFIFAPSLPH